MRKLLGIAPLVALDAILKFVFILLLINDFGFSRDVDTYLASQAIPLFITALVLVFSQNALLPACYQMQQRDQRNGLVLGMLLLVLAAVVPLLGGYYYFQGALFALLPLFGSSILQHPDFAALAGIFALVACCQCGIHIVNVHYHAERRFYLPEIISSVAGAACVAAYLLSNVDSTRTAAVIFLGRSLLHFGGLALCCRMGGLHWPSLERVRDVLLSYRRLFLSSMVYKSNVIWDRVFSALCGEGAMSIYQLLANLIEPAIRLYERMIKPIAITQARTLIRHLNRQVILYAVAPMLLCSLFAIPMILWLGQAWLEPLLLQADVSWMRFQQLLWIMLGMIVGGGMGSFLNALYVGNNLQVRLANIIMICFPISVVARYMGAQYGGLEGFALVTSTYYVFVGLVLWLFLQQGGENRHA